MRDDLPLQLPLKLLDVLFEVVSSFPKAGLCRRDPGIDGVDYHVGQELGVLSYERNKQSDLG